MWNASDAQQQRNKNVAPQAQILVHNASVATGAVYLSWGDMKLVGEHEGHSGTWC